MSAPDRPSAAERAADHPDALGLWGFALASLFGNVAAVDAAAESALITASLVVIGGFLQLVAGRREHELGHTFGATSFTAFGFFWIALEGSALLSDTHVLPSTPPIVTGIYLVVWGLFAVLLRFGASTMTAALKVTVSLSWVGLLLRGAAAMTGEPRMDTVGAWFLIACALAAAYTAAGQFLIATTGRVVLPLGDDRLPVRYLVRSERSR